MAARLIESFDWTTTPSHLVGPEKWSAVGGGTIEAGRNGNGLTMPQSTPGALEYTLSDNQQTLIVAFAYKRVSMADVLTLVNILDGGTVQCSVDSNADGSLTARIEPGNVSVGVSAAGLIVVNTYAFIEMKFVIGNGAAGSMVLKTDGIQRLNVTGIDTSATGNAYANKIQIRNNVAFNNKVDDIYVCDGSGSVNNDFLGDGVAVARFPSGAGASAGLTVVGAGANYQAVSENPPDDDTSYVGGESGRDSYACGDLPAATSAVKAIQVTARSRKDDAVSRSLAPSVRVGSTNYDAAAQGLATSYQAVSGVWSVDPATGAAWAVSAVNALEIGEVLS